MTAKNQKCPICDEKRLKSLPSLHLHCIKKHSTGFVCCPICYLPVKPGDLVDHSNAYHRRRMKWNNEINKDDFKPIEKYKFDRRMVDGRKCMACSKRFCNRYFPRYHYKEVHMLVKYLCHRCSEQFSLFNHLKSHYDDVHGPGSTVEGTKASKKSQGSKNNNVRRSRLKQIGKPSTIAGLRIQSNTSDICEIECDTILKLTYRRNDRRVKLLPCVMNDLEESVDLT